jgi:hypothetical protein
MLLQSDVTFGHTQATLESTMHTTLRRLSVISSATFLFVFGLMGSMPAHAWCGGQFPTGCLRATPSLDLSQILETAHLVASVIV